MRPVRQPPSAYEPCAELLALSGSTSARIRDLLWDEVQTYRDKGRALLAYQTDTEQGFTFRTHEHAWEPVDHEGLTLIHRPTRKRTTGLPKQGWSNAAKRRRFGN